MSITPGRMLGRYEILSPLGSGGMGEVYRARDAKLEREVAVKILPQHLSEDPQALSRFESEAKAIAALSHPNILAIYDFGEDEGVAFAVMELLEGSVLRERLEPQPPSPRKALELALQIAHGLAAAHDRGIIHRDLKPENVFVASDGRVKILDFGLAKRSESPTLAAPDSENETRSRNTVPGTILGTVGYMSPEQVRGEEADQRTDLFSFGILLYEMLAGERPFRGRSQADVMSAILRDDPPELADRENNVPPVLMRILSRCLEKRRDERFSSARDLAFALEAIPDEDWAPTSTGPADRRFPKKVPTPPIPKRHTVGREESLAELKRGLSSADEGRGVLLCVTGEAGIGKTTAVETFLDDVTSEAGPWIGRGRCSERLAGTEAYLPFLEALEDILREDESRSIGGLMKDVAPSWYFQLRPASSEEGRTRASSQERMKRELSSLLEQISHREPVLLFLEDLQWADVSTVDLLAHLADRFDTMRVLIVATYRPEELRLAKHPFLDVRSDLQARGSCREVELPFLSRQDIEDFMSLEFPENAFPPELSSVIHSKTEGSPLFMTDLLRYLRDKQVIAKDNGRWHLAQSIPEIEDELPQSVRGMIERKIDRLSESDRRLMLAASVQGYEFHAAVLAEVLERDPAEIEERLEALGRVHSLIRLVSEEELPDRTLTVRYRFVHVLYQNTLYGTVTPTWRASWSLAVAEALLSHFGEQTATVASELAVLFEAGRDGARAANFYCIAAQNASKVFAYRESIELAGRGLRILEREPETPERAQQELRLQMALGPALVATKGYASPEVGETFARARELCVRIGQTPQVFPVLHGLFRFYFVRSEMTAAAELIQELLDLAEREQDPRLLVPAHRAAGVVYSEQGEFVRAREHFEEGLKLYDREQHATFVRLYGQDEGLLCLEYLPWVLWYLGYPEQAAKRDEESLALAREWSNPYILVHAITASAIFHLLKRDPVIGKARAEAAIPLCEEHGFVFWGAFNTMFRGWALAELGFPEEGLPLLKRGLDDFANTGARYARRQYLCVLAEGYGKAGQVAQGLTTVEEALAAVPETGQGHFWGTESHRVKGELLLLKGETDEEAEALFHHALDTARRREAKSFELRAAMSLSRLWQKQGKQKQARETLAEIYDWFTEGFDTRDLIEAKKLLGELS